MSACQHDGNVNFYEFSTLEADPHDPDTWDIVRDKQISCADCGQIIHSTKTASRDAAARPAEEAAESE